jgi:hypothetical protein
MRAKQKYYSSNDIILRFYFNILNAFIEIKSILYSIQQNNNNKIMSIIQGD